MSILNIHHNRYQRENEDNQENKLLDQLDERWDLAIKIVNF